MNNELLFIDIDLVQRKKHQQNICGDSFVSKRYTDEGRLIAVLSDGLGSGIKANILSSITATMLLNFIAAGRDILKASEVIMNSLPICKVRQISYSTFSAIDCSDDGTAQIVEEGNPQFLWIRNNKIIETQPNIVTSKIFEDRHLNIYNINLQPDDRIIFCSDGITQAGLGSNDLRLGWRRKGLIDYTLECISNNKNITSRELANKIVLKALKIEPEAKDDISAAVVHFRKPRKIMIFTGPPFYSVKDDYYANLLNEFEGKKVICGGTTANLVSRELKRKIINNKTNIIGDLPACSYMDGIDLVTEGILTLTRAAEYLENKPIEIPNDAAGKLVNLLLDSDCIYFMAGAKLNQAHYDPDLPIELEIRKNIVKRLVRILEENYVKKVSLKFI